MTTITNKRKINEIEHGKRITDKAEVYWGWSTAAGKKRAERRAELIISCGQLNPEKNVLEAGCGTGIFTEKLSKTGAAITALDISPDLLNLAKNRIKTENVFFVLGDLENLEFADNSFDAVVGVSILHHINLDTALKEIKRVLKNGGKIVFSEPNMLNPQIMLQKNIPILRKLAGDTEYERAFFRWPLAKILKTTGFKNITIKPFDWLHPFTPTTLIPIVEKMGNLLEKIPVVKEFAGSLLIYAECKK